MTTRSPQSRPRKLTLIGVGLLIVAVLLWRFPLVRVVSLKEAKAREVVAFDAEAFARDFWAAKLLPATAKATELTELLAALAKDPAAARKQFGRSLGMSSTTAVFVRGAGRVTAIEEDFVRVAVSGAPEGTEVLLATGLLFGNAVRDGTGLLDVSAYADSQDFNKLSTALNTIVETTVSPALREQAKVGRELRFAGCLELEEDAGAANVPIVPVKVEWL